MLSAPSLRLSYPSLHQSPIAGLLATPHKVATRSVPRADADVLVEPQSYFISPVLPEAHLFQGADPPHLARPHRAGQTRPFRVSDRTFPAEAAGVPISGGPLRSDRRCEQRLCRPSREKPHTRGQPHWLHLSALTPPQRPRRQRTMLLQVPKQPIPTVRREAS